MEEGFFESLLESQQKNIVVSTVRVICGLFWHIQTTINIISILLIVSEIT